MRNKLFLLIGILLIANMVRAQKGTVTGIVQDINTKATLENATVIINELQKANSDAAGKFTITDVETGKQKLQVIYNDFIGFEEIIEVRFPEANPDKQAVYDLGVIMVTTKAKGHDDVSDANLTVASLDFDDENKGQQISGLLHSTGDVFTSTAGYTLGAAFFRVRGYDSENSLVYMNGIQVNDPETGRASWSEWGGLNDATRNKEVISGLNPCHFSFGAVGGATNIITRASSFRKQIKVSYSLSNKSYTNRTMLTYSTGLMDNGWSFIISGSRRWGQEGMVEGTFYNSWAYFVGAEKKINKKHSIAITGFGSPTRRGQQGGATQEVYDLSENNLYNPNWGYQNGEKRNAKIRDFHEPMLILSHFWTISTKSKLTTSAAYSFGHFGTTALNWYNAEDPRPDYYRYLPSYQENPEIASIIAKTWKDDINKRQIDWDRMYQINYLSNAVGEHAKYFLEDRRDDKRQGSLSSVFTHDLNEKITVSSGLELSNFIGHNFKVMEDLLGANSFIDIDQFAERDFKNPSDSLKNQNDLNNPNKEVKEGDIFGYDYNTHQQSAVLWAQAEIKLRKFEFFVAANGSQTTFWREGLMKNGRAPDNSFGNSAKKSFTNFGTKAGATYKITGRHFIVLTGMYATKAPSIRNSYVSPRIKDDLVANLTSESQMSGELSYIWRAPRINTRITGFQTYFNDLTELKSFYHDDLKTFINYSMSNIDKVHQGIELGTEVKATSAISVILVGSYGNYIYTSRPNATISVENGSMKDTTKTIYSQYFFVDGSPQKAGSLGLKWAAPKYWYFNANFNYFGERYIDFFPERRTEQALSMLTANNDLVSIITQQQKVDGGYTLDLSIGKSLYIKRKYYVNFNFSVSNLLNNTELITGGYEQMRMDFLYKDVDKFPPKYFYQIGRNYFLNIAFRI